MSVNGLLEVLCGVNDAICSSDCRDLDGMVEESKCVGGAHGSCVGNYSDAAVVVEGGCKVPCFDGVVSLCMSTTWFDMYHTFCANWCHGGCIEREHALHGFVCRQLRILCAWPHHVEGDVSLFKILAPVGESVGRGSAGSNRNKMIFLCADGSFCRVGTVHVWWSVLMFCVVISYELFHVFGRFVV